MLKLNQCKTTPITSFVSMFVLKSLYIIKYTMFYKKKIKAVKQTSVENI